MKKDSQEYANFVEAMKVRLRVDKAFDQSRFAEIIGVSRGHVSGILGGKYCSEDIQNSVYKALGFSSLDEMIHFGEMVTKSNPVGGKARGRPNISELHMNKEAGLKRSIELLFKIYQSNDPDAIASIERTLAREEKLLQETKEEKSSEPILERPSGSGTWG